MKSEEEQARKTLASLLKKAKTAEDFNELKFLIDDYLEYGYAIKDYILKYNEAINKIQEWLFLLLFSSKPYSFLNKVINYLVLSLLKNSL